MAAEPTRDVFRQDLPNDRDLTGEDLQRLRFGVTLRGYAMDQVDDVLDRLSGELAERDERIARLEAIVSDREISSDREIRSDRTDEPEADSDTSPDHRPGVASVGDPGAEALR